MKKPIVTVILIIVFGVYNNVRAEIDFPTKFADWVESDTYIVCKKKQTIEDSVDCFNEWMKNRQVLCLWGVVLWDPKEKREFIAIDVYYCLNEKEMFYTLALVSTDAGSYAIFDVITGYYIRCNKLMEIDVACSILITMNYIKESIWCIKKSKYSDKEWNRAIEKELCIKNKIYDSMTSNFY